MENPADPTPPQLDLLAIQQQRVEAASDFLSICDRLSTATADRGLRQWLLLGGRAAGFTDCVRLGNWPD